MFGGAAPRRARPLRPVGRRLGAGRHPRRDVGGAHRHDAQDPQDAGRSWDGFLIQAQAQYAGGDPDRWQRHAQRWKDLGATHLAVATHRAGETDVDGHLGRIAEYLAAVRDVAG